MQLLINLKEQQFAICACKETDPNSAEFSKPEGEQKYQLKVTAPAAADMIYKMMGWNKEDKWNVPGIYFAEDKAIIYDCKTAYKPQPKGGWAAERAKEAALEDTMDEGNSIENADESAEYSDHE